MDNVRQIGISAIVSAGLSLAAVAGQTAPTPVTVSTPQAASAVPSPVVRTSATAPSTSSSAAVKRVQVLGGKSAVEIEIEGSERLVPQTQVLTGPDRLVIDFPNTALATETRSQSVNRGEVKDFRVGLFHAAPPVTRVVVDLKSPQSFQIFPQGKTVIIKVNSKSQNSNAAQGVEDFPAEPVTRPGLVTTNYTAGSAHVSTMPLAAPPQAPSAPLLDVTFRNGMLTIRSTSASLSEILYAVHQRTGADVTLSAGAEQEKVAADIGPAPAPDVLTRLLNGSKFNYMIVSSASDPRVLDKVILSPKAVGAITPLPPMTPSSDFDDDAPTPPPVPQRAEPLGENGAVTNAPPTNMPPQSNPNMPHPPQPPPGQVPSTPPPDDNPQQ
jgi:AMIN domain-containing protein